MQPSRPLLVLLSVAAFAAAPSLGRAAPVAEARRTLAVTGEGEMQAEPDRAHVTLGAEARRPTLEAARTEVNAVVERVLELTRDMGIDADRVSATGIQVRPEYQWNDGRERELLGYLASRQIEIDLRDMTKLGELYERAFALGVNQAGSPELDSSRRAELERQALAKAVEDARLDAEAVAQAADARVGAVRTISAQSNVAQPPIPLPRAARLDMAASAAETYQTGEMTFSATVQIEYDLVPRRQ